MAAILTVVLATTLGITAVSPEAPLAAQIQAASVRLAVADGRGIDYGSGTIVGVYGKKGLIVTCGHIFEHAGPGASVAVILLSSGSEERLPGRVISFDKENDVGLVSVDGLSGADAAGLAAPQYELRPGDRVVVAGCEGGRQSIELTNVVALDRFAGGANVEVAAMPPDGDSGGGLFNDRGELVAVCNGREPIRGQGVYAALPCILQEMKKNGITSVRDYLAHGASGDMAVSPPPSTAQTERPDPAALAAPLHVDPPASLRDSGRDRAVTATNQRQPGVEVVCIVRSTNAPASASRVIILDGASPDFLNALEKERRRQQDAKHAAGSLAPE